MKGPDPECSRMGTGRFVGRWPERRLVHRLLADAVHGHPAIAIVTGLPGSGKTSFLRWADEAATDAGAAVARATAYNAVRPFELLKRIMTAIPGAREALAPLLAAPTDAGVVGGAPPGLDVVALAEAVTAELSAAARRRPIVVIVDDTQELDTGSRLVLEHVAVCVDDAATSGDTGLLVLLSARHPAPQQDLAGRVARLDACRAIPLGPLDEHDVYEILTATGTQLDPDDVRVILEETGGLALLVEAELQARRLGPTSAPAQGHGLHVRGIAEALEVRFQGADAETLDVLLHAAVLGEPWDAREVAGVRGSPPAEVRRVVRDATRAGLIEPVADGRHRFSHPLLRTALLGRADEDRRREVHGAVADLMRTRGDGVLPTGSDLLRLADHLLRSGPTTVSDDLVDVTLAAGRLSRAWGDSAQAARFLSAAAAALPEDVPVARHALVHAEAGDAAYFDHAGARCIEHLSTAIELATRIGDGDLRLRAATRLALARSGSSEARLGVRSDAHELEAALRQPGLDPALSIDGAAVLVDTLLTVGDSEAALMIVDRARWAAATAMVGRPSADGLDASLSRLEFAEGIHRLSRLDLARASVCLARSHEHAVAASDTLETLHARSRTALLGLVQGDVRAAAEQLAEIADQAAANSWWGEAGFALAQRATCLTLMGHPDAATAVEQALRLFRRTGFVYIAAAVGPPAAALAARAQGRAGPGAELARTQGSAIATLTAIESDDVVAVRSRVHASGWRLGFRGSASLGNISVLAALVESGDRLGAGDLVALALPALRQAYEQGAVVAVAWPTLVPRLLAIAARHAGDIHAARRYLDHSLAVVERQGLAAERPKALLELCQLDLADGGSASSGGSLLAQAVSEFDALAMHGWVARSEAVAERHGLTSSLGRARVAVRERTIFTSDIVGSTSANARLGDALYLEELRKHDRIVRAAIRRHRGLEIKHTGDGLNAVFDAPADAVRCACDVQVDMGRWKRAAPDVSLQVRCGLARGSLVPHEGDFFGLVQSEAARLCSMAGAGEVLASQSVVDDAQGSGLRFDALGEHRLRGLPDATKVYRVVSTAL